jgi:hypothetical protein
MAEPRYSVLFLASHPVQYQAPLFRQLAKHPNMEMQVAHCTLWGAEAGHDPGFGVMVKWDVQPLDGYPWVQIPKRGSVSESFFGLYNPGLWKLIRNGNFDAVVSYVSCRSASFWIAKTAAKLAKAAFLFGTDATTLFPRDGKSWKLPVKKICWPMLFGMADQVLALSRAGIELMHSLGIPDDHVTLTPFVVDNDWWKEKAAEVDRHAVRAAWQVTDSDAVILFCAKLQPMGNATLTAIENKTMPPPLSA